MKRRIEKGLVLCCLLIGILTSCAPKAEVEELQEKEKLCYTFMMDHMLQEEGGIKCNYIQYPYEVEWARGEEVLSESQGLGMQYFLALGDQENYDKLLGFVKRKLNQAEGISYRYTPDKEEPWRVNALVDDLRIIKTLLESEEMWGSKSYTTLGKAWSKRLYRTNVKENKLYDFYDGEYKIVNDFITLCYVDLVAVDKMSTHDIRWKAVREEMAHIVEGGYIGDQFPMFKTRYNYTTQTYEVNDYINMVEATLTILHLVEGGYTLETSTEFLKERVEEGRLYTHYTLDGEEVTDMQSTAIYAICAMIARAIDDPVFYEQSIEQMSRWQVMNQGSAIYGAFGNEETLDTYAFDNLMALLAYRKE